MQIKSVILAASVATSAFAGRPGGYGGRHGGAYAVDGGYGGGFGSGKYPSFYDTDLIVGGTCLCELDGNNNGGKGASASYTGGAATTYTGASATYTGGARPTDVCLSDDDAKKYSETVKSILAGADRVKSQADATAFLAESYFEVSDSINLLANKTLGGNTFATKADFVKALGFSAGIPSMETLHVFHDCNTILWRWKASGFGKAVYPVQGMSVLNIDVKAKTLLSMEIEFNNIAWGTNIGWTCTAPPPRKA